MKKGADTVVGKKVTTLVTQEVAVSPDKMAAVSLQMRADAFAAMTVAMLQEFFMSSDIKSIILMSTLRHLEKKYNEDEMEVFRTAMIEIVNKYTKKNGFMG